MAFRAIRGATTLDNDTPDEQVFRLGELFDELCARNDIGPEEIVSIILTATDDVHSMFPATALRKARGLADVPLIGAQEITTTDGLPLAIRVLVHVETNKPKSEIVHVFQNGAMKLRPDLAK